MRQTLFLLFSDPSSRLFYKNSSTLFGLLFDGDGDDDEDNDRIKILGISQEYWMPPIPE